MKRVARKLLEALYFLLCFGPIPLLVGYAVRNNGMPLLVVSACTVPVAFLISILPGRLGGKGKAQKDVFVERTASHGDPDPDRSLRRDTHEDTHRHVSFPLRAVVLVVAMVALAVWLFFGPIAFIETGTLPQFGYDLAADQEYLNRAIMCIVPVFMLAAGVRFCVTGASVDTRNAAVGAVVYAIAGVASLVMHNQALTTMLAVCGAVFLAISLWILNGQAMRMGAQSLTGMKPPRTMRRKNRVLLVGLMALAALVACFNWLKETLTTIGQKIIAFIWAVFMWIGDHMGGETSGGGGGGGGDMDLSGLAEDTAPSPFWEALTYVAYVVAGIILALLLFLLFRKIFQLLRILIRRLRDYLNKFAKAVGEDYEDEQESLLDWGEMQRDVGDALRKRLRALTYRDKKWDDMTPQEKARHLVRVLYRRAKIKGDSRTLREAVTDFGLTDPQALTDVYELARYGDQAPDSAQLESARKDVRA